MTRRELLTGVFVLAGGAWLVPTAVSAQQPPAGERRGGRRGREGREGRAGGGA
jgi:hypothetical protein